jgi:hypothetical protein
MTNLTNIQAVAKVLKRSPKTVRSVLRARGYTSAQYSGKTPKQVLKLVHSHFVK